MSDPRILTAAEIDEIERLLAEFRNGSGGAYLTVLESITKGGTLSALIATVRHERERAELAESIVAGYEREVQSCGDITDEQREHLIQCFDEAKELAREYLAQRPKEAAQP